MATERDPRPLVARWLVAALAAVCCLPAVAAANRVDVELLSEHYAGRFGTGSDSELSAVTLALATAGRVRLRLEVPWVSARTPEVLLLTELGISPQRLRSLSPERLRALLERVDRRRSGLGDLRLAAAYDLAGGGSKLYRLEGELELKAPTADEEEFLGTGAWDARLGLHLERASWSLTAFGGAGWNRLGDAAGQELGDVFDGYAGLESEPLVRGVRWSGWLAGNGRVLAETGSRLVLGFGARTSGRPAWRGAVTVGLSDGAEDYGVQIGVAVHPLPRWRP